MAWNSSSTILSTSSVVVAAHKPIVLADDVCGHADRRWFVASGIAPFAFFPKIDGREINATIAFPNGTAADFATDATRRTT